MSTHAPSIAAHPSVIRLPAAAGAAARHAAQAPSQTQQQQQQRNCALLPLAPTRSKASSASSTPNVAAAARSSSSSAFSPTSSAASASATPEHHGSVSHSVTAAAAPAPVMPRRPGPAAAGSIGKLGNAAASASVSAPLAIVDELASLRTALEQHMERMQAKMEAEMRQLIGQSMQKQEALQAAQQQALSAQHDRHASQLTAMLSTQKGPVASQGGTTVSIDGILGPSGAASAGTTESKIVVVHELDFDPAIPPSPIDLSYDVFLSHRQADAADLMRSFQQALSHKGYKCYLDVDDLGNSEDGLGGLMDAVAKCKSVAESNVEADQQQNKASNGVGTECFISSHPNAFACQPD
jgi:hypothetical protein